MNLKVISSGMLNLAVRRFAGPFWLRRKWLEKSQWLSDKQIRQIQLNLLQRLIRHCYDSVPYYRQIMDRLGIAPEDIKSLEDINRFPIISKRNVLGAGDSILSKRYPKLLLRKAYTGGTTGTPMRIYRNLFSIGNEHAFVRRQWDWANIGFNDRCAYLTGRLVVKPDQKANKLYAYDPIMKELILSTYHLSSKSAKNFAMVMKKYRVKAVVGYPSAVYLLARTCLDAGIELELKSTLTSSETLTDSMRKTIVEAFNCKVFDFYGGAERICYIFTCERGSYHIIPEYGLTELIPVDSLNRNICRIVSSGFWNYAMPFVRYDTGDIVVKSEESCSCGRQFQVIKSISGRQADSIRTPSGREFGAAILTHLLYGTDHILESQIVQDTLGHITIQYVPTENFSVQDMNNFKSLIAKHLPGELKVDFKKVKIVKKTDCGRLKPVLSKIEGQVDRL